MKLHPGMLIRRPSIYYLETFFNGYLCGIHDDCEHFLFENLDEFYNFHYINSLSLSINYADYLMRITDDEEKAFKAFFDNLKTFYCECKNTAESMRIILEKIDKDFPDKSISFDDNYKKFYKYDKIFEKKQSFYRMKYLIDKYDTQINFLKKTKIESFYVFIKDRLCLMNDIISNMQTVF